MKNVLLIKSSSVNSTSRGIFTQPIGLMYLASYLQETRKDCVRIFDTRFYRSPLSQLQYEIDKFKPDVIGISAFTLEAPIMYEIAHYIKQSTGLPVIVGGPHATSAPYEVLNNQDVDVIVRGEGEFTFKELLNAMEMQRSLHDVSGIGFRENDNPIMTKTRPYIENLDELPFPAWDLIEMEKYFSRSSASTVGIRPYMVLFTSRGCPFHCTYCHNIFGKKFRARSVQNVLMEIDRLINDYHLNDFEIIDDISNFDIKRIKAIFKGIIAEKWNIRLSFPNGVRADMLDEETIVLMKDAGVKELTVAVETASDRLQKLVNRNLNLEKVSQMIKIVSKRGIFLRGAFMLGFPTETEAEVKKTIDFACKSQLHIALFFRVTPFEGTELYDQVRKVGEYIPKKQLERYDYFTMPINTTSIPDKTLRRFYMWAYVRFYCNPIRIFRIIRDKPMHNDLIVRFISLVMKFVPSTRK